MAKQRMINTKIWDDIFFQNLSSMKKLLFIYLITNAVTNISGVYEITKKKIAFDTGIPIKDVEKYLLFFGDSDKIVFYNNWIYVKNFIKNQSLNPKIIRGIELSLKEVPEDVRENLGIDIKIEDNEIKKRKSRKISPNLRMEIFERDNFKCVMCGKTSKDAILEIDYIKPIRENGSNDKENLRILCQECNVGRNKDIDYAIDYHSLSDSNSYLNPNPNPNLKIKGEKIPPQKNLVEEYFLEKKSSKEEAEKFFNYYESIGWKVGKNPMKKWKSAASGWLSRNYQNGSGTGLGFVKPSNPTGMSENVKAIRDQNRAKFIKEAKKTWDYSPYLSEEDRIKKVITDHGRDLHSVGLSDVQQIKNEITLKL